MTIEDIKVLIKILVTAYPRFYDNVNEKQTKEIINLWYEMFKNENKEIVFGAVKSLINSFTYPPTIADIKQEIYKISTYNEDSFESVIAEIREAMHNSSYHAQEEFNKLSPIAKKLVNNPSTLREWAISTNFNEQVWRSQMLRQYESAKNRAKEEKMMLPEIKQLIEKMNIKKLEE